MLKRTKYKTLKNYEIANQLEETIVSNRKKILNTELINAKISIDKNKYLWICPETIRNL